MKLPVHTIPTRTEWRKLRDKAGGKSGLAKVEIGPGLDDFHAAYKKSSSSGDLGPLNKEITSLSKKITLYINEVKAKHKDVAAVAKKWIKDELDRMTEELEESAKDMAEDLNSQTKMLDGHIFKAKKHEKAVADNMSKLQGQIKDLLIQFKQSPASKSALLESAKGLQKQALEYETLASQLLSNFSSDVSSTDPAIQEARKKELDTVRESIGKIRNQAAKTLESANQVVKVLSSK